MLTGLVENFSGIFVGFQPGQCQPELVGCWAALDGPGQEDSRVLGFLQLNGGLPKPDRVGDLRKSRFRINGSKIF